MAQYKILVVDDEPTNLRVLINILQPNYKVQVANSGANAMQFLQEQELPDMILLDIMMPEMSGFEVCERLKQNPVTAHIPVIFVTAKSDIFSEEEGLKLGAVDFISKPIVPAIVLLRVSTQLSLYDQNKTLEDLVNKRTEQLNSTRLMVIHRLGRAAEYRDNETGMHVIRMAHYSRLLAESMGIDDRWINLLFNAAPMHDIGKIGIPDSILLKPGKFDENEWKIMKTHSQVGAEIIGDAEGSELFEMAKTVALNHHEKWDGSGYPNGISAEIIPLEARIVAISDVFDALTSERTYKKAWSVDEAISLIKQESGSHFDPKLTPLFIKLLPKIEIIKALYADDKGGR